MPPMACPPAKLPPGQVAIDPALYANIGRYAGSAVMAVFEQIGGTRRMAEWAEENPGDFYTKLFPKVISAPKQIEVTGRLSMEEAVRILDAEEGVDYHVRPPSDYPQPNDFGSEIVSQATDDEDDQDGGDFEEGEF